jgi:hypothetical protein
MAIAAFRFSECGPEVLSEYRRARRHADVA